MKVPFSGRLLDERERAWGGSEKTVGIGENYPDK